MALGSDANLPVIRCKPPTRQLASMFYRVQCQYVHVPFIAPAPFSDHSQLLQRLGHKYTDALEVQVPFHDCTYAPGQALHQ